MSSTDDLWECPGEAHELDNTFNPSFQGPYGPGYHDCDLCDNTGEVTEEEYIEEMDWRKQLEEWREQQLIINKLLSSTKILYPVK